MRKFLVVAGLLALIGPQVAYAQTPVTSAVEPVPGQAAAPPAGTPAPTTMYAAKSANIRAGAGKGYNVIGKVTVNTALQVVGEAPGGWLQLATGGFISAKVVSPTPVAVVAHPKIVTVPAPEGTYPVGACEPYSRVVNIGGQPNQINGTACKQPDGTWRIVNYGVPTPVPEQAPVYVAPAPLVYGPPPVVVYERPYYYRHGPYGRGPYDRY
jgi:hypothetical protein